METVLSFMNAEGIDVPAMFVTPGGWIDVPVVVLCRGIASPLAADQDRQLSGYLESEGIASLQLDFSEAAALAKDPSYASLKPLVVSVGRAMDALLLQPGVDANRVGYVGIGPAGTVGLYLAATDARIRCLILESSRVPPAPSNPSISVPTLFVVGSEDQTTRDTIPRLEHWFRGPYELRIIPRANAEFTSPTAYSRVARDVVSWFTRYLGTGYQAMRA